MNFWQNNFAGKVSLAALASVAAGILAAGCASTPSPSPESSATPLPPQQYVPPPPALSAEQMARLCQEAPDTCHRVQTAQPLSFDDVKVLAKLPVSPEVIIAQVRNSHTVYHLTATNIIDLKSAGVSDQVIDFMISTPSSIAGSLPMPEPEPQTNAPAAQSPPPPPPDDPQPPAPSPDYVWVGGDWVWNGGWVWVGGHWVYPPYPGAVWLHGAWVHGGGWGGYHRMRGRWR
jgi:hypothetical protein